MRRKYDLSKTTTSLLLLIFAASPRRLSSEPANFGGDTRDDLRRYRDEVREMFNHAYTGYLEHAYPLDELRPLSCDGVDTWGGYSLTLIDALDTLLVMGNYTEFQRVANLVAETIDFDLNTNVSVFETNIRVVGGLLSAHILSHKAGMQLEPGWPCNGPLLRLAEDVARRLLPAFDTVTGMPYGTVNLRTGVPAGETSITCTAGIGTFVLEFGTLTRLTGDATYETVAINALRALFRHQSKIGLVGNHVDVMSGVWTSQDSGIGAGIDSYLEYLAKGALLFNQPELMSMFAALRRSVDKYLKHDDWYFWVSMRKGLITLPLFQSLEAYWPGVLSHVADVAGGLRSLHHYHRVWKRYGFTPEFYNIVQQEASANRESYPLRPELVESVMYLYRATNDPYLLRVGVDVLRSIRHSALTACGYATVRDCRDHTLDNRMESFFLAETTKYLYLLFDPDNFVHNRGQHGTPFVTASGRHCLIDAGGYIFNTEAHPIDPGVFDCCYSSSFSTEAADSHSGGHRGERKRFERAVRTLTRNVRDLRSGEPTSFDTQILDELQQLRDHIEKQQQQQMKKNRAAKPKKTVYRWGDAPSCRSKEVSTVCDWLERVFAWRPRSVCPSCAEAKQNVFQSITSEHCSHESQFTTAGEQYDAQPMFDRITRRTKSHDFESSTDFKLLYCKPQRYVQRLSFYGQFFDNP